LFGVCQLSAEEGKAQVAEKEAQGLRDQVWHAHTHTHTHTLITTCPAAA
jgi:hypothetical protein